MTGSAASSAASLVDVWRDRRVRLAVTGFAIAYLVLRWYLLLTSDDPLLGADAFTYWSAPYENPYPGPQLGLRGAYLYPPPFIQILAPLRLLPWEAFHALWAALGIGALVFLVGPVGGALAVTLLPFVYRDLLVGNIHLMLGAAIVLGITYSAAWALPILTKITPGVGLLWFAGRRDWKAVAFGLGVAAAIALASFAFAPTLWFQWVDRLRGDSNRAGDVYMALIGVRLILAAALVVYAGWRGRAWLVPIAVVLALPILWPDSLAILLACFPLARRRPPRHKTDRAR